MRRGESGSPYVDKRLLYELSAQADVDPRSVEKFLRGERVLGRPGDRIAAVLKARGLAPEKKSSAA